MGLNFTLMVLIFYGQQQQTKKKPQKYVKVSLTLVPLFLSTSNRGTRTDNKLDTFGVIYFRNKAEWLSNALETFTEQFLNSQTFL